KCCAHMNQQCIAILGRRDEPTDALEDYCKLLGEALSNHGVALRMTRVRWTRQGWRAAMRQLRAQLANSQGHWALVQYTALSWSRYGFPIRFFLLVRLLKRMGLKVAIVIHEPFPYAGSRLRD